MRIETRTTIIIAVLLVGCEHPAQRASIDTAKIDATEWEVKATEWPLGEQRVCVFFGDSNFAGCWEQYDEASQGPHNRDNHPNDRTYLMRASLPENVKQALAEEHNQRVFCARDEAMHLTCPRGGNIK